MHCADDRAWKSFKCEGCADLNESTLWTYCCNRDDHYSNGTHCQAKGKNPSPTFDTQGSCLNANESCEAQKCDSNSNVQSVPYDSCCYPMMCENGLCVGYSGKGQQFISAPCGDGLLCSKYKQCEPCPKEGETCVDGDKCCDGLACAIGQFGSRVCKKMSYSW